jgi:hypothetical protein
MHMHNIVTGSITTDQICMNSLVQQEIPLFGRVNRESFSFSEINNKSGWIKNS